MPIVTVPKDVTNREVVETLRNNLDARYEVEPGMRIRRSPLFGKPRPAAPELIVVTGSTMTQAQVTVIHRPGEPISRSLREEYPETY
jgi:hypothetical protein